jgi:hypothetical protein
MTDQNEQAHDHEHEGDEVLGMAVGFRIFEDEGALYLAEAEISPYEDDPTALGVTLVFHTLAGIDPTSGDDEEEEPTAFDFDDELTRDEKAPIVEQTQDILRQLSKLSEQALAEYLRSAREDADQS